MDRVSHTCELVREETFGPVIPIIRCGNDIADVIRISNSTAYGLSSGVCTNRLDYITRFINELEVGTAKSDASERRFKPSMGERGPIRVVLGPQDDHMTPEAISLFLGTEWRDLVERNDCVVRGRAFRGGLA